MGKLCFIFEKGIKTEIEIDYWREQEMKDAKRKHIKSLKDERYDLVEYSKKEIMKNKKVVFVPNIFPCHIQVNSERYKDKKFEHITLWSLKRPKFIYKFIEKEVFYHFGGEKTYIVISNNRFSFPVWHIHLGILV